MMDPKVAGYAKHKFQEIQKAYSDILVKEQGKECFMIVISGRLLKNFINSQFYQIREKKSIYDAGLLDLLGDDDDEVSFFFFFLAMPFLLRDLTILDIS